MSTQVHMSDPERPSLRRLPIGAECLRSGGVHFRVWAPRARASPWCSGPRGDEGETALAAETSGYFSGPSPEAGRGHPLPLPPRRRTGALSRSGLALPAGGPARSVAGGRSGGLPLDRRRLAGRAAARARSSTRCTSARSRREGTWAAAAARARRSSPISASRARGDAGRRVPRPLRLGLRRRRPLRPDASLRRARRLAPLRRRRARPRARRHPRRRLQPPRPRRQLPQRSSRPTTSPTGTRPTGARRSTSTAPDCGPVREFFLANAALLDRRVPPRRPAPRRHAEHLRRLRRAHPRGDRPRGARGRRAAARRSSSPRTNRSRRAWCARPSSGGYGLDALWNDDFHHARWSRSPGSDEAYYTDYRGTPQEFISAAKWGYLYQGQRYKWQKKRRGTPGARPAARGLRHLPRRTTIRSPTPRRGQRAAPADEPRPLSGHDGAAAARARHADALPGAGVRLVRAVPLLRRPRGRARRRWCARAAREFLAQFPSLATPEMHGALPDPPRSEHVRALQARLRRARTARRASTPCTATCSRLRREDPVFRAAAAARRRRRRARARGVRAALLRRGRRRPAAARESRPRPAPRSRARAAAGSARGHALARPLVERGPALRRARARRRSRREDNWRIPGHAAVVLAPSRGGATIRRAARTR